MNYLILAVEDDDAFATRTDPDRAAEYWAAWTAYSQALGAGGVLVHGAGLEPPATATTITVRGEDRLVQDGPFVDAKEQLGGYFLIDVPDLDTALDWAARCPAAAYGRVEVRPALPPPPAG
jgi:hypothetical protein